MATRRTILSFKHRYVKAIRWASDRIIQEGEGVIAFVTNNSFIDQIAFDGMRKNLESNFDEIYILDLGGNIRKNPKLSGTTHNVFGIQVGVSINLFVRRGDQKTRTSKIYYTSVEEYYRKEQKYQYLEEFKQRSEVNWEVIQPNQNHTWLTEGLQNEFEAFIPVGNKATKEGSVTSAIFKNYSRGAETARDDWAYNYDKNYLIQNIQLFINTYNEQLYKWNTQRKFGEDIDSFVLYDDKKIKWSSRLKECLAANILIKFDNQKIRNSLYRPFALQNLYFDEVLTHRRGQFPVIFPTVSTEKENRVICVVNEAQIPFSAQIAACIPCLHYGGRQTQCLPFYTYDEDGTNRRENITDWALEEFRTQYQDKTIAKWDIFHYVYAVLHHQQYRDRYAANLKRELPRIPFAPDFWAFANAGKRLAEIHVNYEQQPEYPLQWMENPDEPLNWRVEKMKLSKDKTQLIYNNFLALSNIPPQTFNYRLGNRSALDWIIDQYQFKTDKRSGITNDPNRLDDEQYIVRLIGQVITVSLETVEIVNNLPSLGIPEE